MRTGSIAPPDRRSPSWPAARWPNASRWCPPCGSRATPTSSPVCRTWWSKAWRTPTPARCWSPRCPGRWTRACATGVLAETRGNPLALLELPRRLTPAELAGGFGLPDARPLTSRIEHAFLRRVEPLPRETRLLLLTAAAEPLGDANLLWRAAERLGIATDAAAAAEGAGLIEIGTRVRFIHPLARSAVYRAAGSSNRRDVH